MKLNKDEIKELRIKFRAQVQEEYDYFRKAQVHSGIEKIYKNSLQITFYKEVYRYLMDSKLPDDYYIEFLGEPIIRKLWEVFLVSEAQKPSRDYLRQLIKLYRENNEGNRRVA